jgi:hypothetical protein
LDGDGVQDIVAGAYADDDGGDSRGAVWVLFLNSDGTVKTHQKISNTEGNFTGTLNDRDSFGRSVACLNDLDGDGTVDMAVGNKCWFWVLFLNSDGTVKAHQKISDTEGNFTGDATCSDYFGCGIASIGDIDGDGTGDIAVGADGDDDGGNSCGAVWVLALNNDGTVKAHQKISATEGIMMVR